MNDIKDFLANIEEEFTSLAEDAKGAAEFTGYIDTGCYILNALLSGSIYGGLPNNKITALAGESATGKSYIALGVVRNFLEKNPTGWVVYYDTEAAITKQMMNERGIDTRRVIISEPETIQKFRTHCIKVVDSYTAMKPADRVPMLIVLDSLGMLPTNKELEDSTEGKEVRDMTRAQTIRAAFRVLTLKLGKAKVPLVLTNHTYQSTGLFPTTEISGGGGLRYAASSIVMLGKSKDKDGKEVVGNFIRAKMYKSRISKENAQVQMKLSYIKGLDKYFGLLDIAEKYDIIKKVSTRYEMPDGLKVFGKEINQNPEKYFTPDLLERINKAAMKEFSYGSDIEEGEVEVEAVSEEDINE